MHEKFYALLLRYINKNIFKNFFSLFIHGLHKVNPNVCIVGLS